MIDNVLLLGLETIAPGAKMFVNLTRDALVKGRMTLLQAGSTIVEILETVEVDDEIVAACVELKDLGYEIALDDFIPGTKKRPPDRHSGLHQARFPGPRRGDVAADSALPARREGGFSSGKGGDCEEFARAARDGYKYFQGYFFARPTILQSGQIPANKLVYIQLLSEISKNPMKLKDIEWLVMTEASLCYRVLRQVNSAGLGLRSEVTSVRQALLLLGEEQLRKLITVAAATGLAESGRMLPELILLALQRARFCELVAPPMRARHRESNTWLD